MKTTDIYLVTNGDHKRAYTSPSKALESLENLDLLAIVPRGFSTNQNPGTGLEVTKGNRGEIARELLRDGYLDFAGNTGTVINKITLYGAPDS